MNAIQAKNAGDQFPSNSGYLKLLLSSKGMRIGKDIDDELGSTLKTRRGAAGGVELILPGDVWVDVPTKEAFAKVSPLSLEKKGNNFYVTAFGESAPVDLVPQPSFYDKTTSKGTPFYQVASLHGGEVHITPSAKCHFFDLSASCLFCQEREAFFPIAREFITVEEVIEVVGAAFSEGLADSVELNLGYYDSPDRGISLLEPYIKAIKRNFDTLVAVDVQPPEKNSWIDRTYAMGADKISYHLEIFDREIFKDLCPGKERMIGWDRFVDALKYAASLFPSGTVSTNLIVGLEPPSSTIKGIDFLANIGVVPILPVFRPLKGTSLSESNMPEPEDIAPIYGHFYNALKKSGINMTWSKNVSTYMTPLEARYFAGVDAKLQVTMQSIYKSRIGGMAVRSFAGLRRRLKVSEVEESFESSGL